MFLFPVLLLLFFVHNAQDTFSIVAVDSVTGEVGSAGATCLQAPNPPQGALIISDVIPGKGAIHTQALWNANNQLYARNYMMQGYSAKEILYETNLSDWTGDSTIRQYGVAMFDSTGRPQAAGYTGVNCYDYKNHNLGPYYSIQGNILLGQQIIDSMETRFLNTTGSLAERLMASLQGANVPGADTRCMSEGVPSLSSFLRVAKPTDTDTSLYLHLVVKSRPYGMSPIDSLQTLYNTWKLAHPVSSEEIKSDEVKIYPNPVKDICNLRFATPEKRIVEILDITGRVVYQATTFANCLVSTANWTKGVYFVRVNFSVFKLIVQ